MLLLAIKTFNGRLHKCTGNVDSWFRLNESGEKEQSDTVDDEKVSIFVILDTKVSLTRDKQATKFEFLSV